MTSQGIQERLDWPLGQVDMVLDTDTYNEIDDQFALVYSLMCPERINLQAVYAAPFHNVRSSGPEQGMERSYEEILRVLDRMSVPGAALARKGSRSWMESPEKPVKSEAVDHLIELARARTQTPLYVAAIGAITNISSALVAAPEIREKLVVLWLGGQPLRYHTASEFNLNGDLIASQVLFDTEVPLVFFPCNEMAQHVATSLGELEQFALGKGAVGTYLFEIFRDFKDSDLAADGAVKPIWDLAPLAWLVNEGWCESRLHSSPILSKERKWEFDDARHPIREVLKISRDGVFSDFFDRLEKRA